MATRKQIAVEKKRCGLNCAQAVLCTYADIAGIDEETAIRLAAPKIIREDRICEMPL